MTMACNQEPKALAGTPVRTEALPQADPGLVVDWAVWEFAVSRRDLQSDRRQVMLVMARSFIVWSLRHLGEPRSYREIGALLGGRDHSSIMHLHRRALDQCRRDKAFDAICSRMRARWLAIQSRGDDHGYCCN